MKRSLVIAISLGLLITSSVMSQDIKGLLDLIHEGNIDSAEIVLSELSYTYPGNAGVRYARALMQDDALIAAGLYKDILRNHQYSEYVPGSLMHLGEYYFAQGSYVQSRALFMRLIRNYPDYPELVYAVNMNLSAGLGARQRYRSYLDSAYSDLAEILRRYPTKSFDIPPELDLTRVPRQSTSTSQEQTPIQSSSPLRSLGGEIATTSLELQGQFSLQAGAFGNYDNARRLADQIESIGYTTIIKERPTSNKTLYLIWVGDYPTKTAAMSVADMLEAALGIQSFPVAIN